MISGAAATGAALANASVDVVCKSGTGTATTALNGKYTVTVENGTGPCILTVRSGTLTLRGITRTGTGGALVANITPVSDAIVAGLLVAKGVPSGANAFAQLVQQSTYVPTTNDLSNLNASVLAQINAKLTGASQTPLPAGFDLLGDSNFTPPASGNNADPLDLALDALFNPDGTTTAAGTGLDSSISAAVDAVVSPNPTGATGGTGASGG